MQNITNSLQSVKVSPLFGVISAGKQVIACTKALNKKYL